MQNAEVAVIGGGIVGLATAYQFAKQHPTRQLIVLEKEKELAQHQTGHNSGVLHSGIYYKPGSMKAENCREGRQAMVTFCEENEIPFDICGKVIVAVSEDEIPALESIYQRGQANGVKCEIIGKERLKELEPHCAGIKAIHVPEAGIVNYVEVCKKLELAIKDAGHTILSGALVTKIKKADDATVLETSRGLVHTKLVVNCAGLYCDRVTKMTGQKPEAKIVPFRGEYFELKPEAKKFCRNLIYPVPNPDFPFLGVHFTRMINGSVECGPNAVLAFAREGYTKSAIHLGDLFESLTYSGFLRLAAKYWKIGCGEMWRSFSKKAFVKELKRLVPEIEAEHLEPAPAGVRAQALKPDGHLVDDFLIQESEDAINVNNAPSPAATSSLNIGRLIVDKISERIK